MEDQMCSKFHKVIFCDDLSVDIRKHNRLCSFNVWTNQWWEQLHLRRNLILCIKIHYLLIPPREILVIRSNVISMCTNLIFDVLSYHVVFTDVNTSHSITFPICSYMCSLLSIYVFVSTLCTHNCTIDDNILTYIPKLRSFLPW